MEGEFLLDSMDRVLCWNVRGANSARKQCAIKSFLHNKNLGLFSEWCFCANSAFHNGGRIVLAWNPKSFHVNILKFSSQLIHCMIVPVTGNGGFACTFIYAFSSKAERSILWDDLRDIAVLVRGPWLWMRDFNNVQHLDERVGTRVSDSEVVNFRPCVDDCMVKDIKTSGCFYT